MGLKKVVGIGGVGPGRGAGGRGSGGGIGRGSPIGGRGVAEKYYRRTKYQFKYNIGTYISIPVAFLMGMEHHRPTMNTS